METTYEPCKDIINIQMETRKRKIEEKAHTKELASIGMETARPLSSTIPLNKKELSICTFTA